MASFVLIYWGKGWGRDCLASGAPWSDHLSAHILVKAGMLNPEACYPRSLDTRIHVSHCLSSWDPFLAWLGPEALETIQSCASQWGYGLLTRILEATG